MWIWGEEEQRAYNGVLKVIENQILIPYSTNRPLCLTMDATPVGAGCILAHISVNGQEERKHIFKQKEIIMFMKKEQ